MITIVSGLPRSGTSMMMQMLKAGGLEILTDNVREPNEDNPRGYYEYEPAKRLSKNNSWLGVAEEKALKIVSPLLYELPPEHKYGIIFMQRPLDQILASQAQMLDRSGKTRAMQDGAMKQHFLQHLARLHAWLAKQGNMQVLLCPYLSILESPTKWAEKIQQFLDIDLDIQSMASQTAPSLHRQKHKT